MENVFMAMMLMGLVILLGKLLRRKVGLLQSLYLPSSIIGGPAALLLGAQGLGRLATAIGGAGAPLAGGLWPQEVLSVWASLPGLLISVVFAALFLGKDIPNLKKIWSRAGPMVAHGQALAWGQYVVGLLLLLLLLQPLWGVNPLAGALIEISFEGGHGTAAGLSGTFAELGFPEGADLALGLATIGVIAGVLLGTVAINIGIRRGLLQPPSAAGPLAAPPQPISEHEQREPVEPPIRDRAIEPLSLHLGFVALSIGIGQLLLNLLIHLEGALLLPLGWPALMTHIPLFPLAMIGGVLVQLAGGRLGYARMMDRSLMNRISGTALDLLIVAAMATLSLSAIGRHLPAFVVLAAGGIIWNIFGLFFLAPRIFPRDWMENGLANFGQGMGMTVVGLLLVRMSDPQGRSDALEAFGYKQLLFEPIVGGGLFTAASLPLIHQFGPLPVLIGTAVLMTGWIICGLLLFGPKRS